MFPVFESAIYFMQCHYQNANIKL